MYLLCTSFSFSEFGPINIYIYKVDKKSAHGIRISIILISISRILHHVVMFFCVFYVCLPMSLGRKIGMEWSLCLFVCLPVCLSVGNLSCSGFTTYTFDALRSFGILIFDALVL
jgi:hypothetical protein